MAPRLPYPYATGIPFQSNRSPVVGTRGMVACTQPLASQIGLDILKRGGNAADAAVAVAAALCVLEPYSTGLGGDCFCLFYNASTRKVDGINGSGRSAAGISLDHVKKVIGPNATELPQTSGLAVNVPGAVAGMLDTLEAFGSGLIDRKTALEPAIQLAREGHDFLINGHGPRSGQIMTNVNMA
ncbi:hypothetical protein H4R33_002881, partial [Dimargaris cristalligena]